MPSPYVRRRRLAAELRTIRENRGLTTDELAKLVYQSRTKITRLETAQIRPDLNEVVDILEALHVTGRQYDKLFRLARDAAHKGWWDRYGNPMGPRQKLYADLEFGAERICSYNQTGIPAALQTSDFIEALVELDEAQGPIDYRPERMADARTNRRLRLLQADGPIYDAVLDECMIHRLATPPAVKEAQLRHMVDVVRANDRITLRVLPCDKPIPGGLLPKTSFSLYTFPEAADPPLVVVDTITTDLVHTEKREVSMYTSLYKRLRKVAMSPAASLAFLGLVADRLAEGAGSGV
jgi:transcriptional regulator with XRE-family HTH domain